MSPIQTVTGGSLTRRYSGCPSREHLQSMHVALITKDQNLALSLRSSLHDCGFGMTILPNSSAVGDLASGLDLLICELAAFSGSTEDSLVEIRKLAPFLPLLAVMPDAPAGERLAAFRAGFDDAVSRSFSMEEVAFRAQSLVRRSSVTDRAILKFADIVLDRVARSVTRFGKPLRLTEREFRTMEYLMRNANRVIAAEELCEQVWKFPYDPSSNVVQVFIMRLRKKIDKNFPAKLIHTVPRGGYVLKQASDELVEIAPEKIAA